MRCRTTRRILADVELALATSDERAALDAHLARCTPCAARAARERSLTADLFSLRVEAPFPLDVTARVSAGVSGLAVHRDEEIGARQLAWSTAAVVVFGAGLLIGLWRLAPGAWELLADTRRVFAGVWLALEGLSVPAAALLTTLARSLGGLLTTLGPVASRLEPLQTVVPALIAACALMMLSSIVLVVGRDLTRPR